MANDEAWKLMDRLLAEGIVPNAEAIARIHADDGRIAVVVFEPRFAAEQLADMGYQGEAVYAMPIEVKRRMIRADYVTRRWLVRKRGPLRIFVVMHWGTLLLNFTPGEGYSLEPNSTNLAWAH